MKKIFLFAIFTVLLVVIGFAFNRSENTTTERSVPPLSTDTHQRRILDRSTSATTERSENTTNRYSTIDKSKKISYINIKGLPNADIFYDMNADIIYYGEVCRNISGYMPLVGDKRIYDKQQAILLHKHHYYKFAKSYHRSEIEDMKGDFMGSVVRDYHNVPGVDAYIREVYNKAKADR